MDKDFVMAPLTPHWDRPSHPAIQNVIINDQEFTSKSLSKVSLPPFGLYAKLDFPPCTSAPDPTYATVQRGRNQHLNLNSDLLYINHSCQPTLIFDTANLNVIAGPDGLQPGQELTFFYPSTEWDMAQPFDCLCGKPACRGRIGGAKDMARSQLDGLWLNGHIHELLEERDRREGAPPGNGGDALTGASSLSDDATAQALRDALRHAEKVVEAARHALQSYTGSAAPAHRGYQTGRDYAAAGDEPAGPGGAHASLVAGLTRRGATSRELSGEMGGDTMIATGS
ncbi:hypothetical protein GGR52DRAFT_567543 [Hypoxylon sp. FL1284]|nr:hypothetical protein GGR52DRAFT_567543 [Hypoxylon sp. FL1284]